MRLAARLRDREELHDVSIYRPDLVYGYRGSACGLCNDVPDLIRMFACVGHLGHHILGERCLAQWLQPEVERVELRAKWIVLSLQIEWAADQPQEILHG